MQIVVNTYVFFYSMWIKLYKNENQRVKQSFHFIGQTYCLNGSISSFLYKTNYTNKDASTLQITARKAISLLTYFDKRSVFVSFQKNGRIHIFPFIPCSLFLGNLFYLIAKKEEISIDYTRISQSIGKVRHIRVHWYILKELAIKKAFQSH